MLNGSSRLTDWIVAVVANAGADHGPTVDEGSGGAAGASATV